MVVDEPVTSRLAGVGDSRSRSTRSTPPSTTLEEEYAAAHRGFTLRASGGGWRIYSRPDYAPVVERFLLDGQQARLTQAALETLAVIAYRQPVSRGRVGAIRGVNVDGVMRTLLTRGLIEELDEAGEGGAILYGTTTYFLERMGLELPGRAAGARAVPARGRRPGRARRAGPGMTPPSGRKRLGTVRARVWASPRRPGQRRRGKRHGPRKGSGPRFAGSTKPSQPTRLPQQKDQPAVDVHDPDGVRLQKLLAAAGVGSRRSLRGTHRRRSGRGRRPGRHRARRADRPVPPGRARRRQSGCSSTSRGCTSRSTSRSAWSRR